MYHIPTTGDFKALKTMLYHMPVPHAAWYGTLVLT